MSVYRVEKTGNFTIMSNRHLQDRRLSLKAKGLLSFMLSMPAMPVTTVQKMTGAMIILMSLTKPSPSGFICSPISG